MAKLEEVRKAKEKAEKEAKAAAKKKKDKKSKDKPKDEKPPPPIEEVIPTDDQLRGARFAEEGKAEYDRIMAEFREVVKSGKYGDDYIAKQKPKDKLNVNELINMHRLKESKLVAEQKLVDIRLKDMGMLKYEHAGKVDKFKEKWTELEKQKKLEKIPEGDEIIDAIGLVEKHVKQKTLHQMILESPKTKAELLAEKERVKELTKFTKE